MSKIFVAIASYRDPELSHTIADLFEKAKYPDDIFVSICLQIADEDETYEQVPGRVWVQYVDYRESKGACWAKSEALKYISDSDDYVLLIDSHMRFAQDWDLFMVRQLKETTDPNAFLSTYPAGYEPPNTLRFNTPRLAPVKFFDGVMSMNSVLLDIGEPTLSYLVAGGFIFGKSEMFREVPYDPYIYFIGEEITTAARLFTHGWNGYTPSKCLIHHYYTRKSVVRHWDDQKETWPAMNRSSYNRVRHILRIENTSDKDALTNITFYGLGNKRTLDEFQKCIGVNFNAQVIDRTRYETLPKVMEAIAKPKVNSNKSVAGNFTTVATKYGNMMVPTNDAYIGKSLIEYGEWRDELHDLFRLLINAGDRVVEVGSGFGGTTIGLARLVGKDGHLFAFEQSKKLSALITTNALLNGLDNIYLITKRVSKQFIAHIQEPNFSFAGNFSGTISDKTNNSTIPCYKFTSGFELMFIDAPGQVASIIEASEDSINEYFPKMVINIDNKDDATFAKSYLSDLGYNLEVKEFPFYRKDNFFSNSVNHFGGLKAKILVATP